MHVHKYTCIFMHFVGVCIYVSYVCMQVFVYLYRHDVRRPMHDHKYGYIYVSFPCIICMHL